MNVFIPNKGGHDFSDSLRFGDPIYVTSGTISKFSVGTMARAWATKLENSDNDDYILLSSLTTLCSIGCALFARKHGALNLLLYRNGKYMQRRMLLDDLLNGALDD